MARLPQLADPETYRPCEWDLKVDAAARRHWVGHFCHHLDVLTPLIATQYPRVPRGQVDAFGAEYLAALHSVERQPQSYERIDVLFLDELRREVLVRHGFEDPFYNIKVRENAAALELLPRVLAEFDTCPAEQQPELLAQGLLAGNIFDLGAMPTVQRYRARELDFWRDRAGQPGRPWFIDDVDAWGRRWADRSPYRHVLFFVDNAGSDICLGCLPLVRWMLRRGARVTLAANSAPALNDVTADETRELLARIAEMDEPIHGACGDGRLRTVASGSVAPLIDLTRLSEECTAAAADAHLIILHGMGRAVESNFHARFTCAALWTAVLKDETVAQRVGGKLFDCVFRFQPAKATRGR